MGLLKSLFKLMMGLAAGFALAYAGVSWLMAQERRLTGGPATPGATDAATATGSAPEGGSGTGIVDQTMARFRLAMDEGRRAAAAARAEMEAEIKGRAPVAPAL